MKTVGLPISHKENEKRRALVLSDIAKIENKCQIFIETGYGEVLGIRDEDYIHAGVQITSRDDVLSKDIICDPKIGDADYLDMLNNQIILGGFMLYKTGISRIKLSNISLLLRLGKICMKMVDILFGVIMKLLEKRQCFMLICVMECSLIIQKQLY